jgi:hypothetical protein
LPSDADWKPPALLLDAFDVVVVVVAFYYSFATLYSSSAVPHSLSSSQRV